MKDIPEEYESTRRSWRPVRIFVNDMLAGTNDYVSRLLETARDPLELDIRVTVEAGTRCNVKCLLLYFPVQDDEETQPLPSGGVAGTADNTRFVCEMFWQGRLIAGADALMTEGRGVPYFLEPKIPGYQPIPPAIHNRIVVCGMLCSSFGSL